MTQVINNLEIKQQVLKILVDHQKRTMSNEFKIDFTHKIDTKQDLDNFFEDLERRGVFKFSGQYPEYEIILSPAFADFIYYATPVENFFNINSPDSLLETLFILQQLESQGNQATVSKTIDYNSFTKLYPSLVNQVSMRNFYSGKELIDRAIKFLYWQEAIEEIISSSDFKYKVRKNAEICSKLQEDLCEHANDLEKYLASQIPISNNPQKDAIIAELTFDEENKDLLINNILLRHFKKGVSQTYLSICYLFEKLLSKESNSGHIRVSKEELHKYLKEEGIKDPRSIDHVLRDFKIPDIFNKICFAGSNKQHICFYKTITEQRLYELGVDKLFFLKEVEKLKKERVN